MGINPQKVEFVRGISEPTQEKMESCNKWG